MTRGICCRLCLAPGEECVPIFTNYAADRERLDHKIYSCVTLKVTKEDALSSHICHICISFLNSWQSFKNRCDSAEKKQRAWAIIECSVLDNNSIASKQLGHSDATYHRVSTKIIVNDDNDDAKTYIPNKNDILEKNGSTNPKDLQKIKEEQIVHQEVHDGCKICNKEDLSKNGIRLHAFEMHSDILSTIENLDTQCTFCKQNFEDSDLRKSHNQNLECLLFIICGTCGERFEEQIAYMHHVNQNHMPSQQTNYDNYEFELLCQEENTSSHLRNPQNCPVCSKQYNNYYNLLRHMESKHPNQLPQIYRCRICDAGYPRQSELRAHLQTKHGEILLTQEKQKNISNFLCKECHQSYDVLFDWIDHQHVKHSRFSCVKCDFKTGNRKTFMDHWSVEHETFNTSAAKVPIYSYRKSAKWYNSIGISKKHTESTTSNKADVKIPANVYEKNIKTYAADNVDNQLNVKIIKCGICGFALIDIEALRQHMNKIHGMDKKFFYCNQCTAKFMNEKGLRVHLFRCHQVHDDAMQMNAEVFLEEPIKQNSHMIDSELKDSDSNKQKMFECNVCHAVYQNRDQLNEHMQKVHSSLDNIKNHETQNSPEALHLQQHKLWIQCRYCVNSYNSHKQILNHMKDHEEHDESDYPCKDCGDILRTKTLFWAHRYKQHSIYPDVSTCNHCSKPFFDKTELNYHTSLVHAKEANSISDANGETNEEFHLIRCEPDASFSISDTKIDNDLSLQVNCASDNVYQCDMCTKTFDVMNALQVHRGWHFRSPDGRKIRNANEVWQPDQLPPSKIKKVLHSPQLASVVNTADSLLQSGFSTCPYCYSTFPDETSLQGHIMKAHDRKETDIPIHGSFASTTLNESLKSSKRFQECSTCDVEFETLEEWIDHKLYHVRARNSPSGFILPCDICNKVFTKKDPLLRHLSSHINKSSIGQEKSNAHNKSLVFFNQNTRKMTEEDFSIEVDPLEDADDNTDNESDDCDNASNYEYNDKGYSIEKLEKYFCELCKLQFSTANTLRQHVSEHFLIENMGGYHNTP